jgi:hypothetical protein
MKVAASTHRNLVVAYSGSLHALQPKFYTCDNFGNVRVLTRARRLTAFPGMSRKVGERGTSVFLGKEVHTGQGVPHPSSTQQYN